MYVPMQAESVTLENMLSFSFLTCVWMNLVAKFFCRVMIFYDVTTYVLVVNFDLKRELTLLGGEKSRNSSWTMDRFDFGREDFMVAESLAGIFDRLGTESWSNGLR